MPGMPPSHSGTAVNDTSSALNLPLASMVRALCRAANTDTDILYDVMLKAALMVDAAAHTYGMATFAQKPGERSHLKWVEGLDPDEIAEAEARVESVLGGAEGGPEVNEGDRDICLVLCAANAQREGAAIYGRFARPLTARQASGLGMLSDVARLAHAHAQLREELHRPAKAHRHAEVSAASLPGMVFVSRSMTELARSVERVKDSDSTVLITGESGTGKELVARAVHRLSRRAQAPFIPFNCTAAPADLIESLLFGHRKGAFTGAHTDHEGLVRAAEGGTLFLDEVGDLPLSLQPKLLRFLQEGEVHTLGERAPRKVNVRVLAATHKDLFRMVREGLFREDLYYRVAALTVHVAPLRERPEDITALISHFLSHYARRNSHPVAGITVEAIGVLQSYSWPGNVRELAAEIERLVLYTDEGAYIRPEDISPRVRPASAQDRPADAKNTSAHLENMLEDYERRVITETLRRNDYNVARAAVALGLGSRQTLYKKLKRLAINVGDFLQDEQQPGLQLRADPQLSK
ncbi:MAG: sigma-54-dependent Fis family transcriptional regulator [Acidobacteria bacterium]|nr:MAG: sigma-54-dependent Fis family transcriptional regulator [Acidobacteriota bacterium]